MSAGKYSPTVSSAYAKNQDWWKPFNFGIYDEDGFDSYGYNKDGVDRAGNNELDYLYTEEVQYWNDDTNSFDVEFEHVFLEKVRSEWTVDKETGKPKKIQERVCVV